jgi:four helix bundle protein
MSPAEEARLWGAAGEAQARYLNSTLGMTVRSYRDLEVWQRAMTLVEGCYGAAKLFPDDERFGLSAQIRRAAISVPSNIAEGSCRPTRAYVNHVTIALGSLAEVETCLEIAVRLGYLTQSHARPLLDLSAEGGRMLQGLARSLKANTRRYKSKGQQPAADH